MKQQHQEYVKILEKALKEKRLSKAEYIRIQAVLLRKKGYRRSQIADITKKSVSVIENWITAFHKAGIAGLRTRKPARPGAAKLTKEQKNRVKKILRTKKPKEAGLSGDFWNIPLLKRLVERECKMEYQHEDSYRRLLKDAGLSYQRVEFTDKRRNEAEIGQFKKRLETKIKKGAISMWW